MQQTALRRKPGKEKKHTVSESEVIAIIESGGSAPSKEGRKKSQAMNLRIPMHLATVVNVLIHRRTVPVSKNNWILEAIAEKIEREQ